MSSMWRLCAGDENSEFRKIVVCPNLYLGIICGSFLLLDFWFACNMLFPSQNFACIDKFEL